MNNYISRLIEKKIKKYLPLKQILIITGMRRVGKTTILKHIYDNISSDNKLFFNLEDVFIRKAFSQENYKNIKLFLEQEGLNFSRPAHIFIDEIQYAPDIPSVIKYFYDTYNIKFIASGSSSYYLKNHFSESLAGRKIIIELFPLTFAEFLEFKGLNKNTPTSFLEKSSHSNQLDADKYSSLYEEYYTYGSFPEVVLTKDTSIKQEIIKDIINSYFKIDVTALADFQNISHIRDLLLLLTQRVGQKLNITNLASALGIKRSQIYQYLEFLQSTYVIKLISQKSSIDNKVSASQKVYFLDSGIINTLASVNKGSLFENSVLLNLIYHHNLKYFATKSGAEIDFVVDKKTGLEVKLLPTKKNLTHLKQRASSARLNHYYLISSHYTTLTNTIMAWDL